MRVAPKGLGRDRELGQRFALPSRKKSVSIAPATAFLILNASWTSV